MAVHTGQSLCMPLFSLQLLSLQSLPSSCFLVVAPSMFIPTTLAVTPPILAIVYSILVVLPVCLWGGFPCRCGHSSLPMHTLATLWSFTFYSREKIVGQKFQALVDHRNASTICRNVRIDGDAKMPCHVYFGNHACCIHGVVWCLFHGVAYGVSHAATRRSSQWLVVLSSLYY